MPPDPIELGRTELIPDALDARLYETELADAATGWIFISRGLERVGQQELFFTIQADGAGSLPHAAQTPLKLFRTVFELAAAGTTVSSGGRTVLGGGQGVELDRRTTGFIYWDHPVPPIRLPVEGLRQNPLVVIPLLDGETETAEQFGQSRVLALLGKQARYHPYPWWFDGRREPVADARAHQQSSILNRWPRMATPYVEVALCGARLDILVHAEDHLTLYRELTKAPDVIALLTGPSRWAKKTFVWQPGQTGTEAIWGNDMASGQLVQPTDPMAGNFLSIAHGKVDVIAAQREDGFAVLLPKKLWKQFLGALKRCRPFTWDVPGTEIRQVSLDYRTRQQRGLNIFEPQPRSLRPQPKPAVHNLALESVEFLQSEDHFDAAVTTEDLVSFVRHVELVLDDVFEGVSHDGRGLIMDFSIAPGQATKLAMMSDATELPPNVVRSAHERLGALAQPPVRHEIGFRTLFRFSS